MNPSTSLNQMDLEAAATPGALSYHFKLGPAVDPSMDTPAALAYRTAYLYELPLDGHPPAGGAVCAVIAEVAKRFGPHLRSWRANVSLGVG